MIAKYTSTSNSKFAKSAEYLATPEMLYERAADIIRQCDKAKDGRKILRLGALHGLGDERHWDEPPELESLFEKFDAQLMNCIASARWDVQMLINIINKDRLKGAKELIRVAGRDGLFQLRAFTLRRSEDRFALPLLCPLVVGDQHLFLAIDHPGFHRAYTAIHLHGKDLMELGNKYFQSLWNLAPYRLRESTGPNAEVLKRLEREIRAGPSQSPRPQVVSEPIPKSEPTHSLDFTSVDWFGTRHTFAPGLQARAIQMLWEAATKNLSLSQTTIGENIASNAQKFRLDHVFRMKRKSKNGTAPYVQHSAWGTMIQRISRGCYRLSKRTPPENHV